MQIFRVLHKNQAMSTSSSGHRGQYDTMYANIGCVLRKAFADATILGDHRESARRFTRRRVMVSWLRVSFGLFRYFPSTLGWNFWRALTYSEYFTSRFLDVMKGSYQS